MSHPHYTVILLRHWRTVLLFGGLGLLFAIAVSFVRPLQYSSTVRLLISQDIGASVDAYTASRSEERIAQNLATIIYTTTFFGEVLSSGFGIDEKSFPTRDDKRRAEWRRTVSASVSRGAGILTVTAYRADAKQAEKIARAVAFVLTKNASEYSSGGNARVRLIDAPLNSRWPVKPNLVANGVSGLILGAFVGMIYVLLQTERVRRRHQLVHEEFVA